MLDPGFVRDNLDAVQKGMTNRGLDVTAELAAAGHGRIASPTADPDD